MTWWEGVKSRQAPNLHLYTATNPATTHTPARCRKRALRCNARPVMLDSRTNRSFWTTLKKEQVNSICKPKWIEILLLYGACAVVHESQVNFRQRESLSQMSTRSFCAQPLSQRTSESRCSATDSFSELIRYHEAHPLSWRLSRSRVQTHTYPFSTNAVRGPVRPGKLVPEWHQHFPGLEPRTAYVRGWGDYRDQQDQLKLCDRHFKKIWASVWTWNWSSSGLWRRQTVALHRNSK